MMFSKQFLRRFST